MNTNECSRARTGRATLLIFLLAIFTAALGVACSNPEKAKAEHVSRGDAFLKERKYQEASLEYRNAIQIDENLVAAHWGLAQAYEGLQRAGEAFDELKRVVQLEPTHKDARFKLGTYFLLGAQRDGKIANQELFDEALNHAQELVRQDDNYIPGHVLLANVLAVRGDRDKALAELNRAIELDPKRIETHVSLATFHWQGGDTKKAEEVFQHSLQINDRSSLAHIEYGKFLVQTQRTDDAEAQFRKAVEVDPSNADVRFVLASFYLVNRRLDKAEEAFKGLAELDRNRPDNRARLADFYASTGRFDDALRIYQELTQQLPDYTRGRYRVGEIMLQRGDMQGATAQIDELLKKNPRDVDALLLLARIQLEKGNHKEAIAKLKDVLAQEGRSQLGLYFMAEAQYRDGDTDQARSFAGDLERFYPAFLPAKLMQAQISLGSGDPESAKRLATELLERLDNTAPSAQQSPQLLAELRMKALTARGTANLDSIRPTTNAKDKATAIAAARSDMEQAARLAPNLPSAHVNLADVAAADGRLDEAIQHSERALSIDRTNFQALFALIKIYGVQRQPEQARARVEQALREQPSSAPLHYLKALAHDLAPSDAQTIEASLRRAIELDPDYLAAYSSLAEFYLRTNQPDRAVAEYTKITERRPNSFAFRQIGMVEGGRENYDAAVNSYKRALELNPNEVIAANNLANIYAEHGKGNLDEAQRLAQDLVRRYPEEPTFADTLGWIFYKKGLHDAAIEQLQKAVSKSAATGRDKFVYRYHLAMALRDKGDKAAARRELQAALRLAEGANNLASGPPPAAQVEEARRTLDSL
jgi:tetratricopeptide (TPR) repeat protein